MSQNPTHRPGTAAAVLEVDAIYPPQQYATDWTATYSAAWRARRTSVLSGTVTSANSFYQAPAEALPEGHLPVTGGVPDTVPPTVDS